MRAKSPPRRSRRAAERGRRRGEARGRESGGEGKRGEVGGGRGIKKKKKATEALTDCGMDRGLARVDLLTHPENWPSQPGPLRAGDRPEGLRPHRAGGPGLVRRPPSG